MQHCRLLDGMTQVWRHSKQFPCLLFQSMAYILFHLTARLMNKTFSSGALATRNGTVFMMKRLCTRDLHGEWDDGNSVEMEAKFAGLWQEWKNWDSYRNEEAFYCYVAITEFLVPKENLSATNFHSLAHDDEKSSNVSVFRDYQRYKFIQSPAVMEWGLGRGRFFAG